MLPCLWRLWRKLFGNFNVDLILKLGDSLSFFTKSKNSSQFTRAYHNWHRWHQDALLVQHHHRLVSRQRSKITGTLFRFLQENRPLQMALVGYSTFHKKLYHHEVILLCVHIFLTHPRTNSPCPSPKVRGLLSSSSDSKTCQWKARLELKAAGGQAGDLQHLLTNFCDFEGATNFITAMFIDSVRSKGNTYCWNSLLAIRKWTSVDQHPAKEGGVPFRDISRLRG